MSHARLLCSASIALSVILHAQERQLPSSISSVKVFLSGAEITRTAKTSLPGGASTLVFQALSQEIDPANIQVNGQGSFTILGVRHRLNNSDPNTGREEVKRIEAQLKSLHDEITKENAAIELLSKEEARLAKNELFGGEGGVSMEQLQRMNEYMQQRLEAISAGTISRQAHVAELTDKVNDLSRELVEVRGRKITPTSEVLVDVVSKSAVEARLTLTYLVRSAGWTPSYDLRVKDISQPLELAYKAQVFQSSGEDWTDVALALSSGEPKKGAMMPVLSTWLLDFGMPRVQSAAPPPYRPGVRDVRGFVRDRLSGEALPFVNIALIDAQGTILNGTTTDFDGYYALAIPENGKELRFSYVGYEPAQTTVSAGVINMEMTSGVELQEVEVMRYNAPLIDKDAGASATTITREQIQRMPQRNSAAVGTTISGARTGNSYYYVDGVKVAADGVNVASGGVPANYGAATGGLINVDQGLADRATRRAINFEFKLEVPYTIPSDGQSHSVSVREEKMHTVYRHYCTPKLDLDAFLFAKVAGWDTLNLLPGDARIYFEDTYVGESRLDPNTTGDTLDLSLGRDKGITVERIKRKDFSQKHTMGGKRLDSVGWAIAVRNNKAQAVQLVVTDQFPVPVRSEIEVQLTESSAALVNEEKGLLTWKMALEPRASRNWVFSYSAKYPKEGLVVLE